jgi:hypothetical protein
MMDHHFFKLVKLLQETHRKPDSFNLFKVLRSESDEVRLHSRFVSSVLTPNKGHSFKDSFLKCFLNQLDIDFFKTDSAKVFCEYKNIDILVKNNEKQAIIIENKIYAGDEKQQLYRYYKTIKNEGIDEFSIIYLTLDGHLPEEQSIEGIPTKFIESNYFQCISYKIHIKQWMEKCLQLASLNPSLRESIAQYKQLISELTETDQSEIYMEKLKELLLTNNNMTYFNDLSRAYTENLIDLQMKLWQDMLAYQQDNYPSMGEPNNKSITKNESPRAVIDNYFNSSRNNKYYGLYYPLKNYSGFVGIDLEYQMYIGVSCHNDEHPRDHKNLSKKLKAEHGGSSNDYWPMFKYTSDGINFKVPDRDSVSILNDDMKRQQLAKSLMDELYLIWSSIKE